MVSRFYLCDFYLWFFTAVSLDEQTIDQALLSLDICENNQQVNNINSDTGVSVAKLPDAITDSLNVAAKQLSLFYDSVVNTTTNTDQNENLIEDDLANEDDDIISSFGETCLEQETGIGKRKNLL